MVKLITGKNCNGCNVLKMVLKYRGLIDKVEEVDAESAEGKKLLLECGARSIPVLVNGSDILVGANHRDEVLEGFIVG